MILDDWWVKVKNKRLIDNEEAFRHSPGGFHCRLTAIKDLMYPDLPVSSELVEVVLGLMQYETPVRAPWFFISPYLTIIMHDYDERAALRAIPQLFAPQFDTVKWLFVLICKKKHWVLVAVDVPGVKIHYYTSAGGENGYLEYHWHTIKWLREFLAWRTSNTAWKDLDTTRENCPQQEEGSMDCAIFVLRYVYNLITDKPMNFTQDDISKERVVLAMKLLIHPKNVHQRVMK